MCHAQFLTGFASHPLPAWDEWHILLGTQLFFSEVLPHVAVPLFMLFSGYLLFSKGSIDFRRYTNILKKRTLTLLLPYLIWSTFCFFVAVADDKVSCTFMHWLQGLWDTSLWMPGGTFSIDMPGYPMSMPLWFLRDLMVLVVFSYIIGKLLEYSKGWFLLLIAAWWFPGHEKVFGFGADSLFYFSLGAWLALRQIDFVTIVRKVKVPGYLMALLMTGVEFYITYTKYIQNHTLEFLWIPFNLFVLCLMVATLNIAATIVEKEKDAVWITLSGSSFFLFAAHIVFMYPIMEWLYGIFTPATQWSNIAFYFGFHIIYITLLTALYYVLVRILPRTMALLTGGRTHSHQIAPQIPYKQNINIKLNYKSNE
ncbi:MAG: acyltransferase family protein [Bacteroidales bacterium]|nr:acyltransferase family protein [Bacteroidales bacterium]